MIRISIFTFDTILHYLLATSHAKLGWEFQDIIFLDGAITWMLDILYIQPRHSWKYIIKERKKYHRLGFTYISVECQHNTLLSIVGSFMIHCMRPTFDKKKSIIFNYLTKAVYVPCRKPHLCTQMTNFK